VKIITPIAAALLLAACANSEAISDRYAGVDPVTVPLRGTYRVYDKPDASTIMVTNPAGAAPYQASSMGPVSGDMDGRVPRPYFQQAAQKFLADAGRPQCHITDGYPLARSVFEFSYACAPTN
jgi:hypothetical protein